MTNWEKKFSTPERAAETLQHECEESDYCGACPLASHNQYCGRIVEWLSTEAGEETPCADCEIDYNDKEDGG